MPTRPEIFISATSRDLKSCRQLVRDALLTLGCVPVVQDHFPPGAGEVRAMLRERIAGCQAVIHIAGECYGHEPQERLPADPRRSYTQLEYDIARELKKPLYTFLCAPDFPYDTHDPEPVDLRALQDAHRAILTAGDYLYLPIKDPRELSERVRELQTRVESLTRDLQKTRNWLGRSFAAAVVTLVLIAGLIYGIKRQGEQGQARANEHAAQAEQRASKAEQQLAALQSQLQQQTKLISLVNDKLDRNGPDKGDPAAAAREETARQLGISMEALQRQLAAENGDVRALLARIEQGSAAAEAKASEWKTLKRAGLTKLGDAEKVAGHYRAALEVYEQALALCDKIQQPLVWCNAAQNFEDGLWQIGQYAEAEPLEREILEQRTRLLGKEHPDTLRSVDSLANVLNNKGNYSGAEVLYRQAVEVYERTLGKDHFDTLYSVSNLANALDAEGDYAGAETLYRRCLETYERTLGKDHRYTLRSVSGLADTLYDKGDYAGAEVLYRRCLETYERTLGKEHPNTLYSVYSLASVLRQEGNYVDAEALGHRCLEAQERTLGKEHPDTLRSVNNLAGVLADKGDLSGSEELYRRCLEAHERTLGKEHPDTLGNVNNLANVLTDKGDYAEAEALCRRCLDAFERTLGKEHPSTLASVSNLAQTLDAEGNDAAAEQLYDRAEAGMAHVLPPDHPYCLDLDYHFSLLREKQGRFAEALPLAEHAVAGAVKTLPTTNPDRLKCEKNLADLRAKLATPSPAR